MYKKINCFRFLKLIENYCDYPENIFVGIRNIDQALRFIIAKKILNSKIKISLQIPVPVFPEKLLNDLDNGLETQTRVDIEALNLNNLYKLKPDAVHFFHIDSMLKSLRSTTEGHGEYVQFTDWINWHKKSFQLKKLGKENQDIRPHLIPDKILGIYFKHSDGPQVFPNFIGFHNVTISNLKKFTSLAQKKGYITVSGATNSKLTVKQMVSWHSLDLIMVDDAGYLKEFLVSKKDFQKAKLPSNAFLVETELLVEEDEEKYRDPTDEICGSIRVINNLKSNPKLKNNYICCTQSDSHHSPQKEYLRGEMLYNNIIEVIYRKS